MKTTVDLPETLLAEVREAAERRNWTVRMVFEESLRSFLEREQTGMPSARYRLEHTIVTGKGPVNPGMTLAEMLEISGINRPRE